MSSSSPFAKFVADAANEENIAQFNKIAPFLSASLHTRLLSRVKAQGTYGGGDQPVFWIKGEEPLPDTLDLVYKTYAYTADLLSAWPTVLVSITQDRAVSRPHCIRLADDFGCVLIPSDCLKPEVFVHEIAHLCCFSGHPIIDEGIAFFSENQFLNGSEFNDKPSMSLSDFCLNVGTHDDLAIYPRAHQVALGKAASRITAALVNEGHNLADICRRTMFVEPGNELLVILQEMIGLERLEEAWAWTEPAEASQQFKREVISFIEGKLSNETRDQFSDLGKYLTDTQVLLSDPNYDTEHIAFALQHHDWHNSAAKYQFKNEAHRSVVVLYQLVDAAIGCLGDSSELWEQSYAHVVRSLAQYPEDPLLAATAITYLSKVQMPVIPGGPSIEVLFTRWNSDPNFGSAFLYLRKRLDE